MTPENRATLCRALGIPPQFYRDRIGIDHDDQVNEAWAPIYPPIDSADTWAVMAMEAARDKGYIIRAWPCHNRDPGEAMPSGGWWSRWLKLDSKHGADFPEAVCATLWYAFESGAFGAKS